MTVHVPPWYLAMMFPAICFYGFTFYRTLLGMQVSGVTRVGLAILLLGVLVGGIESAVCWPLYFAATVISFFAMASERKDEDR